MHQVQSSAIGSSAGNGSHCVKLTVSDVIPCVCQSKLSQKNAIAKLSRHAW